MIPQARIERRSLPSYKIKYLGAGGEPQYPVFKFDFSTFGERRFSWIDFRGEKNRNGPEFA
jgi:hypothetical protein